MIALGVFGARPREINSGAARAGDIDRTYVFDKIAMWTMFVLWLATMVWEKYHLQHKLHADRESAGESEKNEISHTSVTRRWLRLWRRLESWTATLAVEVDEARTSTLYQWIAAGVAWILVASNFVALGYVLAEKVPEALFWYEIWSACKYVACVCAASSVWLDLSPHARTRCSANLWGPMIGEAVTCAVAFMVWPDEVGTNITNLVIFGVMFFVTLRLHRRALAGRTQEALRNHVLEVRAREHSAMHYKP